MKYEIETLNKYFAIINFSDNKFIEIYKKGTMYTNINFSGYNIKDINKFIKTVKRTRHKIIFKSFIQDLKKLKGE